MTNYLYTFSNSTVYMYYYYLYNKSRVVHRIRTVLVNIRQSVLVSDPAGVFIFVIFCLFKLQNIFQLVVIDFCATINTFCF